MVRCTVSIQKKNVLSILVLLTQRWVERAGKNFTAHRSSKTGSPAQSPFRVAELWTCEKTKLSPSVLMDGQVFRCLNFDAHWREGSRDTEKLYNRVALMSGSTNALKSFGVTAVLHRRHTHSGCHSFLVRSRVRAHSMCLVGSSRQDVSSSGWWWLMRPAGGNTGR